MKKIKILSLIMATMIIVMFSCTKENRVSNSKIPSNYVSNETDGFVTKVLKYKQRMDFVRQHPEYKEGEEMSIDSAVFYMEAAINFVYGYNNLPPGEIEVKTSIIDMPDEELLNSGQMADKLFEVTQTVADHYNDVVLPDKKLTAVDLQLIDDNGDKKLEVTSAVKGSNGGDDIPHDWWYGEDMGTCDDSQIYEGDAAQQLERRVSSKFKEYPPDSCTFLFYGINQKIIKKDNILLDYLNENDPNPQDNYLDYLIFYADEQVTPNAWVDSVKCLTANIEVPFYDNNYTQVVSDFISEHPGKKFKELKVEDKIEGKNSGSEIIWHKLTVIIGRRLTDCGPEIDTIPTPIGD